MDHSTVRIIAGVLCILLVIVLIQRRRQRMR
ncbi:MAG: hypothetical protein JWN34_3735 [Bryobacterales bacterium]|nr:hypothetical protein [Bryobacterales bacterium]